MTPRIWNNFRDHNLWLWSYKFWKINFAWQQKPKDSHWLTEAKRFHSRKTREMSNVMLVPKFKANQMEPGTLDENVIRQTEAAIEELADITLDWIMHYPCCWIALRNKHLQCFVSRDLHGIFLPSTHFSHSSHS